MLKNYVHWQHNVEYKCSVCGWCFDRVKSIFPHLHAHLCDKISITCPFKNCLKVFTTQCSFKFHVYRNHKKQNIKLMSKESCSHVEQSGGETAHEDVSSASDQELGDIPNTSHSGNSHVEQSGGKTAQEDVSSANDQELGKIPNTGIFRSVSQQAARKYPQSLLEKDSEGNIISLTTTPLLTMMRNRNYFLNRSPNTKKTNIASNIPFKKRRQTIIFQNTCPRWEIQEDVPPKDLEVMKSKQKYLKTLFENGFEHQEANIIQSHMKDCYWLQRQYLNNMDPVPSIKDVQINWPFLFYEQCLCQHFEQLMEIKANIFCENFKQSLDKLKKCLKSNKDNTIDSDLKIIKQLVNYFGENPDFLLMNFEIETTMDAVRSKLPSNLPIIAIIETERAFIFIEKTSVAEYGEYDLINLVKVIINYYFVLNKTYPAEISQTLEFLTRFCYKHYPNQTRGAKKNINNLQKVNNLVSKISNM